MAAILSPPSIAGSRISSFSAKSSDAHDDECSSLPDPAILLAQKITSALKHEGYDHYSVERVRRLVEKNACTEYYNGGRPPANDSVATQTNWTPAAESAAVCAKFMEKSGRRQALNSNELVLIIMVNRLAEFSVQEMRILGDSIFMKFRDDYNIHPVRMYVGGLVLDDREYVDEVGLELAVTVLNVCNTEIGSPSMIQLLDNHAPSDLWSEHVFLYTAWRDRELLWQSEISWYNNDTVSAQPQQSVLTQPIGMDKKDVPREAEPVLEELNTAHDRDVENTVASESEALTWEEDAVADDETSDRSSTPIQHPAALELAAREAARASIAHPTWDHADESASLVDLVRSHAARAPHSEEANDSDFELI